MRPSTVAAVVIARNEGSRLQACLTSLQGQVDRIVYVDSGSTDNSVSFARGIGAQVVELDTSIPFTAARARNAGFYALQDAGTPDYVQFVDGDCRVEPGWIAAALATLDQQPGIGIVTGWRREIAPERSVYNALAEVEWHRPAGEISTCGGDMMVRSAAFDAVRGFDPSVIAAEDDDFCLRVRATGLRICRLPQTMTHHDSDITRFSQWWRRTVRTGHGFAQVGRLQPGHFVAERRRVWFYGLVIPLLALAGLLAGLVTGQWLVLALAIGAWGFNWFRTWLGLMHNGQPAVQAAHHSVFLTLSKVPNLLGMLTFHFRRLSGADMRIIEYKGAKVHSHADLRVGLIGAGYIASKHADALRATPGVHVVAVCDPSESAASALAARFGAQCYGSVADLLKAQVCDAVHILTPPPLHHEIAMQCLAAGLHVFIEKPIATSAVQAVDLVAAAEKAGRRIGICHNFLGIPGYVRLKSLRDSGRLGRISSAEINWCYPLSLLRSGPFGLWMLREPGNLLLELGPHLYAFAVDLFGPLEILGLSLSKPIDLPGGGSRHQGWHILARAGGVDITIVLSLVETMEQRSITLRGSSALAQLDFGNDCLVVERNNTADLTANPLVRSLSLAAQHLREGLVNVHRQTASLGRKSPYALGFQGAVRGFYDGISTGRQLDPRFGGEAALLVMQAIEATLAKMPAPAAPPVLIGRPAPKVMVIGGTGFIGRNLTRTLVARGHDVRVLSRSRSGPFDDIADHVETVPVALTDHEGLRAAMAGIDTVYNLAKSTDKSWAAALENDVGTTVRVAEAAEAAKVRRLVYTGTIASYDMSDPAQVITEATEFGDLAQRNIYARSKAECEARLLAMHRDRGLPLVIARPGIVLGNGGPLQHWGIGRWHGAGAVRLWGNGHNVLPFVLVDDVSDGLIRMLHAENVSGQSFNLIGDPMLTARDYFDAIHALLGAKMTVTSGSLNTLWLADGAKFLLKRHAMGQTDALRSSRKDWLSRAHLARFDNSRPKAALGWVPEADKGRFLDAAVTHANLLGF